MSEQERPKPQSGQGEIHMNVPPDLEARYTNVTLVRGLEAEIVIDFAQGMHGKERADVVARVVMTPVVLKLFHNALGMHITKYEDENGEIKLGTDGGELAAGLFQKPTLS